MGKVGPGHVIADKYRLDHPLGEGGMGSVWSAEHLDLKSKVAIKLIVPDYADDPGVLARFVREARSAAALRSPHVVQIFDYGVDEGLAYIAMEQLEGESLAGRLKREKCLSPHLTATIVTHVARAIGKAHEAGLVHRDLKPDNVFLVQNDDEVVAKVLDFGVAKIRTTAEEPVSARTATGAVVGSPFYMSPEQARGRRDIDFRSDLWAIGVIAFECLTGQRPFTGESLGEVILMICSEPIPVPSAVGTVPPGFDEWFGRAVERDVDRRFQSAKELSSTLRRVLPAVADAPKDVPTTDTSSPVASQTLSAPLVDVAGIAPAITRVEGDVTAPSPVAAESNSLGSTTTGATSRDGRVRSVEPAPAASPTKRAAVLVAVSAIGVAAAAWLLGGTTTPRSSAEPAAARPVAAAVPTSAPPVVTPAPQPVVAPALPSAAPNPAPAASASATPPVPSSKPGSAAPAGARPAAQKPSAKPAPSAAPAANPLDMRF